MSWVWVLCFCGGWWLESSFCSLRWLWLPSLRPAPGRRLSLVFHFPENVLARIFLNLWRKHWELVGTRLFAIALSHSILTTSHVWSWAICWINFHSLVWGPVFLPYSGTCKSELPSYLFLDALILLEIYAIWLPCNLS